MYREQQAASGNSIVSAVPFVLGYKEVADRLGSAQLAPEGIERCALLPLRRGPPVWAHCHSYVDQALPTILAFAAPVTVRTAAGWRHGHAANQQAAKVSS